MKRAMRAYALHKKVTLLTAAFVLAVSSVTASVPFILSQTASAVATQTVDNITTFDGLQAALDNPNVRNINLAAKVQIAVPTDKSLVLARDGVRINGNDSVLHKPIIDNGWRAGDGSEEAYLFKVWKANDVEINSLRMRGGDAGMLVASSQVILKGNTHVDGHEFGGIEVSRSASAGSANAHLTLQGALWSETAPFESKPRPSVWIIDGQGSVNSSALHQTLTSASYVKPGQTLLYRNAALTESTATNTSRNIAYETIQGAINAANPGETVRLDKDVTLANSGTPTIRITKELTFDGNNKTIFAPLVRGTAGGENNAAMAVVASNVTVKNLSTVSQNAINPAHGIVVRGTGFVSGVTLQNITTTDATSGLILNNSEVTVDGISTIGSRWYGIGIDVGAQVTVKGANSHSEVLAIKNESNAISTVTDEDGQYVRVARLSQPGRDGYTLASNKVTAQVTVNNKGNGGVVSDRNGAKVQVAAQSNAAIKSHWVEIVAPNGQPYYLTTMSGAASSAEYNLRDAAGIPKQDGYLVPGVYTLRYVATNTNEVRNDDSAPAVITVTVDNKVPELTVDAPQNLVTRSNSLTVTGSVYDENLAEYKYQILDANKQNTLGAIGFSKTGGTQNKTGDLFTADISGLPNGTYHISVWASDKASNATNTSGNRMAAPYIMQFTIDRTISSSLEVSALNVANPTLSGVVYYNIDPALAQNVALTVSVDGVETNVVTDQDGVWTLPITVENGNHNVSVFTAGDPASRVLLRDLAFTTTIPAPNNGGGQGGSSQTPTNGDEPEVDANPRPEEQPEQQPQANGGFPLANFGGIQQQVLGQSNQNDQNADSDAPAVEGVSTQSNFAQAVDSDSNQGRFLGLAWYWWMLILAGIALIGWWIAAAVRRRQAEN